MYIDFNLLQIFFRTQIDLGQLFFFNDSPSHNTKLLNFDSTKRLINLHFSYFKLEKISSKCCWKILGGIVILTCHTSTSLTSILNEIGGSDTSLTCLLTYSTKFKLVNVIKLISWFDQIDVGITMVPIENKSSYVANIKSSSLLNIPKWKS